VVAGVCAPASERDALSLLGVRDSKMLSDGQAQRLARAVREVYPSAIVAIGPERYNALYAKMGNLNRLLAWAHARVIENLLEEIPDCHEAVSDQFGDARLLERALLERGRRITLTQRPRAESDPIVAAASSVARAEFLRRLEELSTSVGMPLPKGAGPPVLAAGRAFVARHGADALARVAKVHFKTTRQLTGAGA
jgi:ribonuclease HIII